MTTTTNYTSKNTVETRESSGWVRPIGVATSAAVALVIWAIGGALGADYVVPGFTGTPDQVNAVNVIVVAGGISLVGWGFLALLERFTKNSRRVWTIIAAAFTVLSIIPNALMAGTQATVATAVSLILIHLGVGATLITVFRRSM